jgi:hypothetical protein
MGQLLFDEDAQRIKEAAAKNSIGKPNVKGS